MAGNVNKSRKRGRKKDRNTFVDEVVRYEDTGVLPDWARVDQFAGYAKKQAAITDEERAASRKRLGL